MLSLAPNYVSTPSRGILCVINQGVQSEHVFIISVSVYRIKWKGSLMKILAAGGWCGKNVSQKPTHLLVRENAFARIPPHAHTQHNTTHARTHARAHTHTHDVTKSIKSGEGRRGDRGRNRQSSCTAEDQQASDPLGVYSGRTRFLRSKGEVTAVREGDRDLGGLREEVDRCEEAAESLAKYACHHCVVDKILSQCVACKQYLLRPSVDSVHRHCRLCLISDIKYIRACRVTFARQSCGHVHIVTAK